MHYSLTSCQLYFLVPLSSFLAHLLALSHIYIYISGRIGQGSQPGSAQDWSGYRVVILDSSGSAQDRSGYRVVILDSSGSAQDRSGYRVVILDNSGSAENRSGYRVVILDSSGSAENRSYGLVAAGKAGTQTQHRLQGHDTRSWWGIVFLHLIFFDWKCWNLWLLLLCKKKRNRRPGKTRLSFWTHFCLSDCICLVQVCYTALLHWSNKITAGTADSLLIIFHSIFWS